MLRRREYNQDVAQDIDGVLARMRRHRRRVTLGRIILPVIIATLVGWLLVEGRSPAQEVDSAAETTAHEQGYNRVVNGRWRGQDRRGRPFELRCAFARQMVGETIVDLVDLELTFFDPGGQWLIVNARRGTYDIALSSLRLAEDVHILRDDGLEFNTQSANADLRTGAISGTTPLSGQSRAGVISAQGFAVENWGRVIRFDEQVRATGL